MYINIFSFLSSFRFINSFEVCGLCQAFITFTHSCMSLALFPFNFPFIFFISSPLSSLIIYFSIHPSIHLPTYLFNFLSLYLFVCLSIYLFFYLNDMNLLKKGNDASEERRIARILRLYKERGREEERDIKRHIDKQTERQRGESVFVSEEL